MKERRTIDIPAYIRVDSVNSLYRFDLSDIDPRGDVHDFYELVYVESGLFSVLVDGVAYRIPGGSLFIYAPNSYHVGNSEVPMDAVISIVSFSSRSEAMHAFDNRMISLGEEETRLLKAFFAEAHATLKSATGGVSLKEGVRPHRLQLVGNLLEGVLLSLYREGEGEPARQPKARQAYKKARFLALSSYLKQNLGASITLADMARQMACSISAVKALCRGFCAMGPNEYLGSLRIGRARELIREGNMTFTQIAEATGFGTIHYFSRVFKAHTGLSPSQYAAMVEGR